MPKRDDARSGQGGSDRNWEKTADRVKDAPESTGKISRGAPEHETDDDRSKQKPVRTGVDRNTKS